MRIKKPFGEAISPRGFFTAGKTESGKLRMMSEQEGVEN